MILRFAVTAALAAMLGAGSAFGQSAAELLQQGIYQQQTVGNVDSAISIYRQVIASNPSDSSLAGQAQFRLFQALLQKGDKESALHEFQTLMLNYPTYRDLAMSMLAHQTVQRSQFSRGTVQNNRYHHTVTGIEFGAPPGWALEGDGGSSDDGDMVMVADPKTRLTVDVWLKPQETPVQEIEARLRRELLRKQKDRVSFPGWTVRPSSVVIRPAGGGQALAAIADFTFSTRNEPMVECLTWVVSARNWAFFFGRTVPAQLPDLQTAIEQMLTTALVP